MMGFSKLFFLDFYFFINYLALLFILNKNIDRSLILQFSSVPSPHCVWLVVTPWTTARPSLPVHHQLREFTQTHVHWVGDAIQPSHPLLSLSFCIQSFPASGLFKWVSSSHQVAKILVFQLQLQSSNEYSGLISFRIDWLDLLAVQGTLKSLLQHHSSKASILQCSAFFIVQLSHPHLTTGKINSFE